MAQTNRLLHSYLGLLRFNHPTTSLPSVLKSLKRLRTRATHFDGVIEGYKEKIEHNIPFESEIKTVKDTLTSHEPEELPPYPSLNFPPSNLTFLPPHLLHYSSNSKLSPHVDSVRFSGPSVSVLTLSGSCTLRLTVAPPEEVDFALTPGNVTPAHLETLREILREREGGAVEVDVQAGEGYVLTGVSRYLMEHAVSGVGERVAVVFRDELTNDF
ncbi:hypothetical protein TrCOL_g3694 [Triparma columacea]|uniref:Fe2OG dioxygenase domain-containing protein n=1 Tax=Triparma columacea TaxID=722753 RepID=A0A9W7GC42_9STRA|nr:hypothetical protein TrCOL_g3694 [Triparma columacea]